MSELQQGVFEELFVQLQQVEQDTPRLIEPETGSKQQLEKSRSHSVESDNRQTDSPDLLQGRFEHLIDFEK